MKLLFCKYCNDVISLDSHTKTCSCGNAGVHSHLTDIVSRIIHKDNIRVKQYELIITQ